jgi:3-hydroxyisobutyrate dehydrogenase
MVYATIGGLAAALAIGQRGGLDWAQMLDVIAASAIGSPLLKARDFTATFTCLQARKDLGLIEDCIANGNAEDDYAAMIKAVERRLDGKP